MSIHLYIHTSHIEGQGTSDCQNCEPRIDFCRDDLLCHFLPTHGYIKAIYMSCPEEKFCAFKNVPDKLPISPSFGVKTKLN